MNDKYLSISALTKYLKFKFDNDDHLRQVFLKGEISNLKLHSTGHLYFSLKDETSKINAIMFSINTKKLLFKPVEGMKVLVAGRISIYETTGNYQIYIDDMLEDGLGNLYVAFEQLKEKLNKEGLFNKEHKKPIPKMPKRIGIITAPTGAAIKDILSTIKRRYPICETILFPSLVQGDKAAKNIATNIELANTYSLDVLIVGRGGGSIEDLWPFNEEIVARAIYNSIVPIVSAVGHEIDFTIADYVADLRAPTPTGAAEMIVPNIADIINHINQLKIRLNENIIKKINYNKLYLDSIKNSFVIKNPLIMYENKKQKIDLLLEKINTNMKISIEKQKTKLTNLKNNYILNNPVNLYEKNVLKINTLVEKLNKNILLNVEKQKIRLNNIKNNYIIKNPNNLYKNNIIKLNTIIEKLELLNPLSILKRGFTLTYINGKMIKSSKEINIDDNIQIKYYNGSINTKVINIKEKYNGK
ncbi:MAG: exodeoxyribonuclease VII large subunit [Bacilli bacterium]